MATSRKRISEVPVSDAYMDSSSFDDEEESETYEDETKQKKISRSEEFEFLLKQAVNPHGRLAILRGFEHESSVNFSTAQYAESLMGYIVNMETEKLKKAIKKLPTNVIDSEPVGKALHIAKHLINNDDLQVNGISNGFWGNSNGSGGIQHGGTPSPTGFGFNPFQYGSRIGGFGTPVGGGFANPGGFWSLATYGGGFGAGGFGGFGTKGFGSPAVDSYFGDTSSVTAAIVAARSIKFEDAYLEDYKKEVINRMTALVIKKAAYNCINMEGNQISQLNIDGKAGTFPWKDFAKILGFQDDDSQVKQVVERFGWAIDGTNVIIRMNEPNEFKERLAGIVDNQYGYIEI